MAKQRNGHPKRQGNDAKGKRGSGKRTGKEASEPLVPSTGACERMHVEGEFEDLRRRGGRRRWWNTWLTHERTKGGAAGPRKQKDNSTLKEMDVDEFLSGGFLQFSKGERKQSEKIAEDRNADQVPQSTKHKSNERAYKVGKETARMEEEDSEGEEHDNNQAVLKQNEKMKNVAKEHKEQLENLKEMDPEFYEYLQQTDKELLDFDMSEGEEEEEEEEEEEQPGDGPPNAAERIITTEMVEAWTKAVTSKGSLVGMKNLLRAYRLACHFGDNEEELASSFSISGSNTFNMVMLFVLQEADGFFRKSLYDGADRKQIRKIIADPSQSQRWPKIEPLVKSYLGNSLHILNRMTDSQMISFTLRQLKPSVFMLNAFEKFQRKFLKTALSIMGRDGDKSTRIQAVLFIREMTNSLQGDFIDKALKGVYRTFSSHAKFVTQASLPSIGFLSLAVTEMYGIDFPASYRQAFASLKQLAGILRNALTMKAKESYKEMYSWQTINCLQLWCRVLSTYATNETMKPLVYPLLQLLLGTARLVPTGRYTPLRLRLCKSANQICEASGVFAPVAPILLENLALSELSKAPKAAQGKVPDFSLVLKVSKATLRTTTFHEECVFGSLELLSEHLSQWSTHVAFPELSHTCLIALKRFVKSSKVERFRKETKRCLSAIEKNAEFVVSRRDQVEFCPKDITAGSQTLARVESTTTPPLDSYYVELAKKGQERRSSKSLSEIGITNQFSSVNLPTEEDSFAVKEEATKETPVDIDFQQVHSLAKVKKQSDQSGQRVSNEADDSDDEVRDLMLSSSEEEGEDAPPEEPPTLQRKRKAKLPSQKSPVVRKSKRANR